MLWGKWFVQFHFSSHFLRLAKPISSFQNTLELKTLIIRASYCSSAFGGKSVTFKPKVLIWTSVLNWSWARTITKGFQVSTIPPMMNGTDATKYCEEIMLWIACWAKYLVQIKISYCLFCYLGAERSIFLLTLKDKNALVFLLLIQMVPFFLLWLTGCVEHVCHFSYWFMKTLV